MASASPPLLEALAKRVRDRRHEVAMTVRELGAAARVSERFLVSLEGGRANVSVVTLAAIATALGTTASALLEGAPGPKPATSDAPLVALLGLRGAGKTAIGARVASRLGRPFVELDQRVTERAGMGLGAIFELHGNAYYRRLEREELARVVESAARGVLATGGSIVTDDASYGLLRRSAVTVWLKAKPEDHLARVLAQGDARPMANRADAMNELRALLRARRPLYERADFVVDTSKLGLERAVDRVVKIAREGVR